MDNSKSSFPTSRSHEIPFFSEFHEWEALTFEIVYAKIPHMVDRVRAMSNAHEGLEEEYSKRYKVNDGQEQVSDPEP